MRSPQSLHPKGHVLCPGAASCSMPRGIKAGERLGGGRYVRHRVGGCAGMPWETVAAAVVTPRACLTCSLVPAGGADGGTAAGTPMCVWSVAPGACATARLMLCLSRALEELLAAEQLSAAWRKPAPGHATAASAIHLSSVYRSCNLVSKGDSACPNTG